ncbi:MAG: 50S ribosomal protein L32 [Candidatus Woykebacteria bacterium RBG_13_40_15]|uniref:Large ribosomal subunit protein bL32 n=1 Tax=Candidatus Woykebacteria bacterium RBG_13_40_15 TaxID=1802593 RepID=A0A1G1W6Y3_9BACT|nr:MAG: 50S ribosomal protein L32 [Candidatus Woykebacteria bacterium RBG_13_40_15]
MTPLPKKKISKSRGRKRLATKLYKFPNLVKCQNCGKLITPHVMCPYCGTYNKLTIFKPKEEVKVTKVNKKEEGKTDES